jgi:hypothetical protein
LSGGGFHDFEEARRGAGVRRIGQGEIQGAAPALTMALAGIAGAGVCGRASAGSRRELGHSIENSGEPAAPA